MRSPWKEPAHGFPEVTLCLPAWVEDLLAEEDRIYPTVEDRMRLAVELSRFNI
jgi:hypothetical protein